MLDTAPHLAPNDKAAQMCLKTLGIEFYAGIELSTKDARYWHDAMAK